MKLSVCIPIYNVEKYIERCARSLFEQTMKDDIEFIFVDDCTPDASVKVLSSVLEEYPQRKNQVKILHHKENQGLTGARNTALANASGDYIIHCDSDDWVDLNLYEKMYESAIANQSDMVACAISLEDNQKTLRRFYLTGNTVDDLFKKSFNSVAFNSLVNKMFTRKIVMDSSIQVPNHITMAEDLLRTTQMLLKCQKITLCNYQSYHYSCSNSGASTSNFNKKAFQSQCEVIEILLKVLPPNYEVFAESLKGQVLFSSLRIPETTRKDYYERYPSIALRKAIFNHYLAFPKRVILTLSLISFHIARVCCQIIIAIGQKMNMK